MVTEQLISPVVPTLILTDTGNKALLLMEENNLEQIPLIAEDKYMGLVQENDVMDWNNPDNTFEKSDSLNYKPAVFANGHPFDALKIAHEQNLSIVPVVDYENTYLGAITRDSLLKYITETSGIETPGGIIVLEVDPRNYSLYEIARICENENVLIISSQLFTNRATGMFEVTIKTNRTQLNDVIASLQHRNYKVKEVFGDQTNKDDIADKYQNLMNYLNM